MQDLIVNNNKESGDKMISIRGAITVINDTKEEVLGATEALLNNIILNNDVQINDIISIIFTCTKDISSVYPAVAARELGIVNAGLICVNEMNVLNSLNKCIRVLFFVNKDISQIEVKHIYMGEARILRPDFNIE